MGLFSRQSLYDRTRILEAAGRARAKRRRKKAIALYRRVLAVERGNAELHAKIAPLLAVRKEWFDAWVSYQTAARAFLAEGLAQKALATYREAVRCLPGQIETWLAIVEIERKRGRDPEAILALREARRHFRRRRQRPQAIYLLRGIREIEAWDCETILDLANLLAKSHQQEEAALLLRGLAGRSEGRNLRRVRAAQWRLAPTIGHTWLWLCAALARDRTAPARAARRSVRTAR